MNNDKKTIKQKAIYDKHKAYRLRHNKTNSSITKQFKMTHANEVAKLSMMISKTELAEYLNISRTSVYNLIKNVNTTDPADKLSTKPALKPLEYNVYHDDFSNYCDDTNRRYNLIIADPPYNLSYRNHSWDDNFNYDDMMAKLVNVMDDNSTILIFNTFENILKIRQSALNLGLCCDEPIIYAKGNPNPLAARKKGYQHAEWLLPVHNSKKSTFNKLYGEHNAEPVLLYSVKPAGKTIKTTLGIRKPESLMTELILRYSNVGDHLYVPFSGTLPELSVAKKYGRSLDSTEIDTNLYNIIKNKIN